jgi:hypothetical protein
METGPRKEGPPASRVSRRVALLLPTAGDGAHPALAGDDALAGLRVVSLGSRLRVGAPTSAAVEALEEELLDEGITHLIVYSGAAAVALGGLHLAFEGTLVLGGDDVPKALHGGRSVRFVYGSNDPVFSRNAEAVARAGGAQMLSGCDHALQSYVASGVVTAFVRENR